MPSPQRAWRMRSPSRYRRSPGMTGRGSEPRAPGLPRPGFGSPSVSRRASIHRVVPGLEGLAERPRPCAAGECLAPRGQIAGRPECLPGRGAHRAARSPRGTRPRPSGSASRIASRGARRPCPGRRSIDLAGRPPPRAPGAGRSSARPGSRSGTATARPSSRPARGGSRAARRATGTAAPWPGSCRRRRGAAPPPCGGVRVEARFGLDRRGWSGRAHSSRPAMNTIGNSRPFAACSVISESLSASAW